MDKNSNNMIIEKYGRYLDTNWGEIVQTKINNFLKYKADDINNVRGQNSAKSDTKEWYALPFS